MHGIIGFVIAVTVTILTFCVAIFSVLIVWEDHATKYEDD